MEDIRAAISDDQLRQMAQSVARGRQAAFRATWQGTSKQALTIPRDRSYRICFTLAASLGVYNAAITGWVLYERLIRHSHVMQPSTFYLQQMLCLSLETAFFIQCLRIRAADRKLADSASG